MLTLITGAPGTGKSNAVVSMIGEFSKERAIYVNGIPELKIPHVDLVDLAEWHNVVPDGSVIVGDEAQTTFRPTGPGQKIPESIAKLETHRHRGLDLYLITQGPNLIHANVRALVGRHVHLRDLGILGRWWYEWPECNDQCRTAWKNAPIKKRYKLDKEAQKNYKSASVHIKPVRSIPWMLAVMIVALCVVAFMSWKAYGMFQAKMNPAKAKSEASAKAPGQPGASGASSNSSSSQSPEAKWIDDRVAFIPRISAKPETAPAYDEIRKVVVMPRIAGGMSMGKQVRCFTQQGTSAGITEAECRAWLADPPFDPYSAPIQRAEAKGPPAAEKPSDANPGGAVVIGDRGGPSPPRGPDAAASEAPRRPLARGGTAPAMPL